VRSGLTDNFQYPLDPEFSMALTTLQDLFMGELQDVYSAEKQILKALPKMARTASSPDLRRAFEIHHKQTEEQVARLDTIFEQLGARPRRKKCKGMEGLLAEGTEIMEEEGQAVVIDAGLIAAAQRVEHYEIAAYGCLRSYAMLLGQSKATTLLEQTLEEEEAADQLLSDLADGGVNQAALSAGAGSGEEE
jgi:ferritin-like metal-binding protein YciE